LTLSVVTSVGAAKAEEAKKDSPAMGKAEKLYGAQKFEEAAKQYREVIREEPDNAKAHQRLGAVLAGIGTTMTDEAARKEQDDTAILEEKTAIKLDPKYYLPHVVLGQIYANRNQYEESINEFELAVNLKPNGFRPHLDLGIALTRVDRWDEALKAYRKASEIKPDAPVPHINIGVLLQNQGDFEGAIVEERKALELKPNQYEAHAAHFNLGNIYADSNEPDNAITEYQEALKINPRHLLSQSGVGWMMARKGEFDGAIAQQRKVLKQLDAMRKAKVSDPAAESIARGRLATALAAKGDKKEAEKEFDKCLNTKPANPITMMDYGLYLEKEGRKGEAKTMFQKALEIQPSFKPAKDALAKLETGAKTK